MPSKQNIAIKFVLVLFVCATHFALTLIACSCGNRNSSEDLKESNDGRPFLVVHGTDSELGAQNVEVIVEIKNNPGILGIDFEIYYDDTVMVLLDSQSTLDLEGCVYTSPSYYRNPTTFLWDFQDVTWTEDGAILKLYFNIFETASLGKHEIKLMYEYGNIFDANGIPLDIEVKNAYINIEE